MIDWHHQHQQQSPWSGLVSSGRVGEGEEREKWWLFEFHYL